jgi:acetyl esterase/lipase
LALPRLPPRIEHSFLRFACGLPPSVQRALFGKPPRLDGQVLATELNTLLAFARMAGDESASEEGTLTPAQARERLRSGSAATAGAPGPSPALSDLAVPGPAGAIPARFYEPAGMGIEERPLIVYFHGGGWTIGDLDTCESVCRFLALHTPATVLSIGYRLGPEDPFPAAFDDALAAFRWAAEESPRLGVDPARIALAGDSAGANLAAAVSLHARDEEGPRPAMQALLYPVTDVLGEHESRRTFARGFLLTGADMDWFERHYLPDGADRSDPRVSVLHSEDLAGLPPAYVAVAGFDPLRDEGEAYAKRMEESGVAVTLRRQADLIHGFANMTAISDRAHVAMVEIAAALRAGLAYTP